MGMADGKIRRPEVRRRTEDERLLYRPEQAAFKGKDASRVLRIMGEFVEGFEELTDLGPAVTIFGSARISHEDLMYGAATEVDGCWARPGSPLLRAVVLGRWRTGTGERGRPERLRWG